MSNRASLIPLILARPRDRRDPPGLPYRLSPMGCLLWLVPYGINSTFRNFPCVGPIENRGLPIGAAHRGQPIYQWATRRSAAALLLAGLVTPVKHGFYQFCDQRSWLSSLTKCHSLQLMAFKYLIFIKKKLCIDWPEKFLYINLNLKHTYFKSKSKTWWV